MTNAFYDILNGDDIQIGDDISYQLCKLIYLHHPLGATIVDLPINKALAIERTITIGNAPETLLNEAFNREWVNLDCDNVIVDIVRQSRIYGFGSAITIIQDLDGKIVDPSLPIDYDKIAEQKLSFNIVDPLGSSGSMAAVCQDLNSPDYQKIGSISAQGKTYHPSRCISFMNERPVYLSYTSSAYGYVGRSVYSRALFPLKSFLKSMLADDMLAEKTGLLIYKSKKQGSIIDRAMIKISELKRSLIKGGITGNVLEINQEESIETLVLTGAADSLSVTRNNIIENISNACRMPSILLTQERLSNGLSEGDEDAKELAAFTQAFRTTLEKLYDYLDKIVSRRAWTPEFYATIQREFSEYKNVDYEVAYRQWRNDFKYEWPSSIQQSENERIEGEAKKLECINNCFNNLIDRVDDDSKLEVIRWHNENINSMTSLFSSDLLLDI